MIKPREIKLEELRLGNLFTIDDRVFHLDRKFLFAITSGTLGYQTLFAIPLTLEWLIKLGFHEVSGVYAVYGKEINIKLNNGYWDAYFKGKYVCVIKHVHQLQNLFYAIFGRELTLGVV